MSESQPNTKSTLPVPKSKANAKVDEPLPDPQDNVKPYDYLEHLRVREVLS